MILGIGLDVVEIPRIARIIAGEPGRTARFLARCFTPAEREYCEARRAVEDAGDAPDLHHVHAEAEDHGRAWRSRAFISRTARSMPTSTAWATMAWPMLSSSISAMAATGRTLR